MTVDTPVGVSLKDCTKVSRPVSAVLDVEDPNKVAVKFGNLIT